MKIFIITVLLSLCSVALGHPQIKEQLNDDEDKPRAFIFIFSALALGALCRSVLKVYHLNLPYILIILMAGCGVGMAAKRFKEVDVYTYVTNLPPEHLLMIFLPAQVFKMALFIDAHSFTKSSSQICLISLVGVLLTISFVGMITSIISSKWSYTKGLIFGTVISPIYCFEINNLFKDIGYQTKHMEVLLEGEAMMGTSVAIVVFYILMGSYHQHIVTWYHVIAVFARYFFGGLLVGYLFGKIWCYVIRALYNDSVNVITTTLVAAYVGFYISEEIFFVSGALTVTIIGIMISIERTSLASDVEMFLLYFWELLTNLLDHAVFFVIGVLVTKNVTISIEKSEIAKIIVTYVLTLMGRFGSYILLSPILSRIGYGFTFSKMAVAVWGGLKGAVTVCLTLILCEISTLEHLGQIYVVHVFGVVFLTLLINYTTMPIILDVLGLSEISLARKANMNNCLRVILGRRERTISMLKMDRFLSDANWPMVNSATLMKHPYKMNYNDEDDDDDPYLLGYRIATCPDCKKEVLGEPTAKEFAEMTREARMRILKAKKISYARQYENGMLSKDSIRILRQAVEVAMDTPEALIEIEGLQKLFQKESFSHFLMRKIITLVYDVPEYRVRPPRRYWRRVCYHIVKKPKFIYAVYVVIVLNVIPISLEMYFSPKPGTTLYFWIKLFNFLFFCAYLFEFLIKVYAYSWIYICRDGLGTYFKSCWNRFDFVVLVAALADLILDFLEFTGVYNKSEMVASKLTLTGRLLRLIRLIRVIRLIRLIRLCKILKPTVIRYWDSRIDKHMAFAYDVGKGFVTGEEEVYEMLTQMIDNKNIIEDMKMRIEADRLVITRELGLVQKDRPWIAITVKTKQAITVTINSILEAIMELKVAGWVDDIEYRCLMECLDELLRNKRKIKAVEPSPAKVIFKEISWLSGDEEIANFLYNRVITKKYDPGDIVCVDGLKGDGIYIVVTGLLKLTYNPQAKVLDRLNQYGELPIVDYINSVRFDERFEDYIVSGNSFGELSTITKRPYNCIIVANTPSLVYIITHDVIQQAMQKSIEPINGLEARLWKTISMRMALAILLQVPAYQTLTQDKIRYELERAFVPNLSKFKILVVNEMIEDIILIYGLALDYNTQHLYTAPCYIPRTVQKIVLSNSSQMTIPTTVETKLLIIPTRDVDEYDIMDQEEQISEMISTASSTCIQHTIQKRIAIHKRKKTLYNLLHRKSRSVLYASISALKANKSTDSSLIDNEKELQSVNLQNGLETLQSSYVSTSEVSTSGARNGKSKQINKVASVRSILKPVSRYSLKYNQKPLTGLSEKTSIALEEIIKTVQSDSLDASSSSKSQQKSLAFKERELKKNSAYKNADDKRSDKNTFANK